MLDGATIYACGDGAVLFDGAARLVALDAWGARIWRALRAGLSPDAIAASVAGAAGDPGRVRADILALIDAWRTGDPLQAAHADLVPATARETTVWAGRWRCRLRDAVIDVAVERPHHAAIMRRWIEHFPAEDEPAQAHIEVRGTDSGETITSLDGKVFGMGWGIRQANRAMIMLAWPGETFCAMAHAGAVADDAGAICIAGTSGSGKSTLIARLAGDGFDYLCDDLIPLTMEGRIAPWPMPLSVKVGSWTLLAPRFAALETAPSFTAKDTQARLLHLPRDAWHNAPRPTRAIVFPRYRAGDMPAAVPISPIEALQRLIEAGLRIEAPIDAGRIEAMIAWLERTPAYSLAFGDLEGAVALIRRLPQPL